MLDDVVEIASVTYVVTTPAPDPSNIRAALVYLEASGAQAISVTAGRRRVGIAGSFVRDAAAVFWLPADKAKPVAAEARRLAGDACDTGGVIAALHEAAGQLGTVLTPHDAALARAAAAAQRLDDLLVRWRACGIIQEFTKSYRVRRLAAAARGEGFMSYGHAELRLKRALVPLLANGGKPEAGPTLFAKIFDGENGDNHAS